MRTLILLVTISSIYILARTNLHAQTMFYIPDPQFATSLSSYPGLLNNTGDSLIISEAKKLISLDCTNANATNLNGIQYFTNLKYLTIRGNKITSIPNLDSLRFLIKLNVTGNKSLTSLPDLSMLDSLQDLVCHQNNLSALPDLSNNKILKSLDCHWNNITVLPSFSNNLQLESINIYNNHITVPPDLSQNTKLKKLICGLNPLTNPPDISMLTELTLFGMISTYFNSLPEDYFINNHKIESIYLYSNKLVSLPNLTNNTELKRLTCDNNKLATLPDLSKYPKLIKINFYGNKLKNFPDLSNNLYLEEISIGKNHISDIPDLSYLLHLKEFKCSYNYLNFSSAKSLRQIDTISSLKHFTYTPQSQPKDTNIYVCISDSIILTIPYQDSATSHKWYMDNVEITNSTDTFLVIKKSGSYSYKSFGNALNTPPMNWGPGITEFSSRIYNIYVNSYACSNTINTLNQSHFEILPCPVTDRITIKTNDININEFKIYLYSSSGKLKTKKSVNNSLANSLVHLDITSYENGIYFMQIVFNNRISTHKVIKL